VKRSQSFAPVALCCLSLAGGCDEPSTPRESSPRTATTARDPHAGTGDPGMGHAGPLGSAHAGQRPSAGTTRSGTVRETLNAAGYTYLRIESASGASSWVAAIEMPLAVGDEVLVEGGNEMVDFHSRTLDRTFPEITFAGSVRVLTRADGQPAPAAEEPAPGTLPPGHPPMGGATDPSGAAAHAVAEAPSGGGARGVVRETMNAGGYTYMNIEGASGSVWVAVPQMTVAVGNEVEATPGMEMPGFRSSTLDRTFEQLTFASGARVLGASAAAPAHL